MEKINEIIKNNTYIKNYREIQKLEKDRRFCRHTMEHFLDVARIAYITSLEENLNYSKDLIYGAALLHDIGRAEEYKTGINHDTAGRIIAGEILNETSYTEEEKEIILNAIENHGTKDSGDDFSELIYKSDKMSRNCFACSAEQECYWSLEKKNFEIKK